MAKDGWTAVEKYIHPSSVDRAEWYFSLFPTLLRTAYDLIPLPQGHCNSTSKWVFVTYQLNKHRDAEILQCNYFQGIGTQKDIKNSSSWACK